MTVSNRRAILKGFGAAGLAGLSGAALIKSGLVAALAEQIADLKPGQYLWNPERSAEGPVAVVVSLPDQRVHIYRNGVRIGVSTCSTGKKGHSTPTGVFTILQKDKDHHSSTYNNAPMPNMNRLTWSGVALHAGKLPGYPASHGCIRLPYQFSELLWSVTHVGTPVIVADAHSEPNFVTHPGPILSALAEDEMALAAAQVAKKKLPPQQRSPGMQHAASLLVSGADREIYVLKDGRIVTKGSVEINQPDQPLGTHVFVLVGTDNNNASLRWKSLGIRNSGLGLVDSDAALINRVRSDPGLAKQVSELMHPGLVLLITDQPATPETRTDPGFVVIAADTTWQTTVERAN